MSGSVSLRDLLESYIEGTIAPCVVGPVERIIETATAEWRAGVVGGYRHRPDDEFDLVYQWVEQGCPAQHTPKWPGVKPKKQFHYDGKKVELIEDRDPVLPGTRSKKGSLKLASSGSSPSLYDGSAQSVTRPGELAEISDEKLLDDLARLIENRITACLERCSKSPVLYKFERRDLRQEAHVAVLRTRGKFRQHHVAGSGSAEPVKFTTWITTVIDNHLTDYARRELRQPILGDQATTISSMASNRTGEDFADYVLTRCALDELAPTHAQTIIASALAKNSREASEMVGIGHAAFRQRLKRTLDAIRTADDQKSNLGAEWS